MTHLRLSSSTPPPSSRTTQPSTPLASSGSAHKAVELSQRTATTSNTPTATNTVTVCASDAPPTRLAVKLTQYWTAPTLNTWRYHLSAKSAPSSTMQGDNPPELLLKKLHKAWTEATLKKILPYISALETLPAISVTYQCPRVKLLQRLSATNPIFFP